MVWHGAFAVFAVASLSGLYVAAEPRRTYQTNTPTRAVGILGYSRHERTCRLHCVAKGAHSSDLQRVVSNHGWFKPT